MEAKAIDIIKELPVFSWKAFEKKYLVNRAVTNTIDHAFSTYAAELRTQQRIGTAVSYECAGKSLSKFKPDTKFTDVTKEFLQKYEQWTLNKDNSISTVGIYLRSLRTLFNNAIAEGELHKDYYPFGRRKYEIPSSENNKKALTLQDVHLIFNYQVPAKVGSTIERSRDYWVFSYLCYGINIKDIALLKYRNIKGGEFIEFVRAKTVRTKRTKVEAIRVLLTNEAKAIIKKHGNNDDDSDNYIFPILSPGLTAERTYQVIQQTVRLVNDHMKLITNDLKIEGTVTTYSARHSFSTILKRSGISTEFISEALGHADIRTTRNYLASFEDDKRLEASKALTNFKK